MKNIFKASKKEIKKLFAKPFFRLAILVISCLPLIYGVLYLWAFLDPYSKLSDVPVAVVNEDKTIIDNNQEINYGQDLIDNLKEDKNLKWDFVTNNEANVGLEDYSYYAEIIIPDNFSENILSLNSDNPSNATIEYKSRESNNMIAEQITSRVAEKIIDNLNSEITAESVDSIFLKIAESADGLDTIAENTNKISGGQTEIIAGEENILTGISNIVNGTNDISNALKSASEGSNALAQGNGNLYSGMHAFNDGVSELSNTNKLLLNGATELNTGIDSIDSGINTYIETNEKVLENLKTADLLLQDPDTINTTYHIPNKYVAQQILATIITQSESTETTSQITALQIGLDQLSSGSSALASGIDELDYSVDNSLIPASRTIENGLDQSYEASKSLSEGINQIYSGNNSLLEGSNTLYDGQTQLISGLNTLNTKTNLLTTTVEENANKIREETNQEKTENLSSIIADPIILEDQSIDTVANYGTGFAPYFLPLALWVGGLVLFLLIKLDPIGSEEKKLSPVGLSLSKFMTLAKIGTLQTVILDLVIIFALGITPINYFLFFTFTILASWCFIAILQLLVFVFQDGGKFLGILLLMLQLTSASGTYPIETTPTFFQKINPYLPMTYVVKGLREIISGANMSNIISQYEIISIFFVSALILLIICSIINKKIFNLSIEKHYEH